MRSTKVQLLATLAAVLTVAVLLVAKGLPPSLDILTAADRGDYGQVRRAVNWGVNVNTPDDLPRFTPLHWAALNGHATVAEILVAGQAEVNPRDRKGRTPLHLAASVGSDSVVALLVRCGADTNARSQDGRMPLYVAAGNVYRIESGFHSPDRADPGIPVVAEPPHLEAVAKLLLAGGADVNAKTGNGQTPLHAAANAGTAAMVELLLANGAAVNLQDNTGRAPLHVAADRGQKDIVELILAHGAEVNVRDNQRRTPLHFAGYRDLADFLRQHGAQE